MLNARSIQGIIILTVGAILAVWLGLSIATNQVETILQVIMAVVFVVCLGLGRKIWLLIPFTTALDISLRLPGLPNSLLIAQILVLGFCTPLFLMRKLPFRLAWTELEFWMLVLTLFVVQVYMRNPVGVNAFGGDTVGGRPYAIYVITMASAMLLAGLRVPPRELNWILRLAIIGGLANMSIGFLGRLIPALGYYTVADFVQSDEVNYEKHGTSVDKGAATRSGTFLSLGNNLSLWIASYISPLRALIRPLWGILVLLAIASAMLAGYRNAVFTVGITFFFGIAYRSGITGLVPSTLAAIAGVALLGVINLLYPLPPNVQRSLTILPGTWEQRYKDDAKASSDWRFDIWREALTSEKWIRNKWLGDGLGFSATELAGQLNERKGVRSGLSGFDAHRETILVNGDYHSGPVSTIRTIGYVGLFFFLVASIRLAVHGHRQILRCRGSEWLPLALFVGIPLITGPLIFVFIFGDFKKAGAAFLLSCAMIRLLENNLPLPAYVKRSRLPFMLQNGNPSLSREQ